MDSGRLVVLIDNEAACTLNFRGDFIAELTKSGYSVVVMAPDCDPVVKNGLLSAGMKSFYPVRFKRTSINPFADIATFVAIASNMRDLRPAAVITYTIKPAIWGGIAAKLVGVSRIVPVITGLGFSFTAGRGFRRRIGRLVASVLYRISLRAASSVLFLNPDDLISFRRWRLLQKEKSAFILNGEGVNLCEYFVAPMPRKPAFLMIARLLRDKGVNEFAEAARILKERYPDTIIRLVGSLDSSPDSITQAELDQIVAGGVEHLGQLDDVRPAIAGSSVYVLPSYYREGTPRSTLEAMSMGRAVVTTDAPGCRETVVDGVNGYLVPPRDAVSLAAAMEKFILDPALAGGMGAESRRIVEERYDVHLVNAEIMRHAGLLDPAG